MTDQEYIQQDKVKLAIDRIAYYTDNKDLDKVLENFSEDAEYIIIVEGKALTELKGKPQIRENMAQYWDQFDFLFHLTGTKLVDYQPLNQVAISNTCCIVRQGIREPKSYVTQYVEYSDKWLNFNGLWYLVSRTVNIVSESSKEQV